MSRLRAAAEVDGLVLTGSAARGPLGPASDVDLVVVLAEAPESLAPAPGAPFEVVFTRVGGRAADVVVTTVAALRETRHEPLTRWIVEGEMMLDRSGAIAMLRERAEREPPAPWPDGSALSAWWSVCFELVKAERYAASGDARYREAAEWIVAATFTDALRAYFQVRALPWRGERAALAHWEEADPPMLRCYRAFLAAGSLAGRLSELRVLAETVLAPVGGVWADGTGPRSATWETLVAG